MMVVGFLMLVGRVDLLLHGIWTNGKSKPDSCMSVPGSAGDGRAEAGEA